MLSEVESEAAQLEEAIMANLGDVDINPDAPEVDTELVVDEVAEGGNLRPTEC